MLVQIPIVTHSISPLYVMITVSPATQRSRGGCKALGGMIKSTGLCLMIVIILKHIPAQLESIIFKAISVWTLVIQ